MDTTSTSGARVNVQPDYRIGHGYDLHRLEVLAPQGAGKPFVLGGVRLTHTHGPVAHSDGDALYHAVTDGILGALGLPDIGQLFPDTDPRHESEDSRVYLKEAARRAFERGYVVSNLDVTVILERPMLSPVKEQMRDNVASALRIERERVNIKGKTHEKVDAVGEGRAVEVHVVVMLVRP